MPVQEVDGMIGITAVHEDKIIHSNLVTKHPASNEGFMLGGKAPPPSLYHHKFGDPGYLVAYHGSNMNYPFYETLSDVEKFQARPSDVCVATSPKTGTTFVSTVVHMIMHQGDLRSLTEGPPLDSKVLFLEFKTPFMEPGRRHIDFIKFRPSPRIYYTHLGYYGLPKTVLSRAKIIYVTRNPKDTITSMYYFLKCFPSVNFNGSLTDMADAYFNNAVPNSPFFDHVAGYWKNLHRHSNILFITFEEVVKDFPRAIRRMAEFLGQHLSEEQVGNVAFHCHFDQMKTCKNINRSNLSEADYCTTNDGVSPFMRQGKIGNWKENFTPELNQRVDEWITREKIRVGDDLKNFSFQYE